MGTLRGKVGDLVFTRLNGKQITKSRNRQPMNRRTTIQQTHRAKIAACIRFFAMAQQNLFKFAYEDQRKNETDMNAFIRHNFDKITPTTKYALSQNCPIMGSIEVTNGSLESVKYSWDYGYVNSNDEWVDYEYPLLAFKTDVAKYFNDLTVGDVSKALIRDHGCEQGDILTFVMISMLGHMYSPADPSIPWVKDDKSLITNYTQPVWKIYQFRVDTSSSTLLRQKPGIFNPVHDYPDEFDESDDFVLELGRHNVKFGGPSEETPEGYRNQIALAALIRSRVKGGKTFVSSEVMKGNEYGQLFKLWKQPELGWEEFCGSSWEAKNVTDIAPANILQGSESYEEIKDGVEIDIYRDEECLYRPVKGRSYQFLYLKVQKNVWIAANRTFYPVGKTSGDTLKVTVAQTSALLKPTSFIYIDHWVSDDVTYRFIEPGVYRLAYDDHPEQTHVFTGDDYSFVIPSRIE